MRSIYLSKMWNLIDLPAYFIRFENENKLFEKRLLDQKFWAFVRWSVYDAILKIGYHEDNRTHNKKSKYFKYIIALYRYFFIRRKIIHQNYDLVFVNTSGRKKDYENIEIDSYSYPIIQKLKNHYNILLIDLFADNILPEYNCDSLPMYGTELLDRSLELFMRFSNQDFLYVNLLSQKINSYFDVSSNVSKIIKRNFFLQYFKLNRFKKILSKCSVKVLVHVNNGSVSGIIEAANQLGIKVVELQHGQVTDLHVAYNYYTENSSNYAVPDFILTFGKFWNDSIKYKCHKEAVGYPYLDIIRKKIEKKISKDKNKIIVISDSFFTRKELVAITMELARLLPEYIIYYKLRLEEYDNWKVYYPKEFQTTMNIVVIDNNNRNLYEYFQEVTYQIGTGSTALFEGLAFGVETFILNIGLYLIFNNLIEKKIVSLVTNANEVLDLMKKNTNSNKYEITDDLFLIDSLEKMESFFYKLL